MLERRLGLFQGLLCLFLGLAEDREVVGVADQAKVFLQRFVEFVEIEIGQERRDNRALGQTA